ncbi:unnamed protein product [Mytilus coruscus]|uniref:Uncharacterized protein n=1 Tax=Mytilus coruscus TaxID=42192 RepID=A0A6J8E6W0_MYTCO|nr:unnamed protein product [Mytilus coruscus]
MILNSIPQPAINWESTNLVDKWKKFQQDVHVDLIFEGSLADKDEKVKITYLLLWIGDKGSSQKMIKKLTLCLLDVNSKKDNDHCNQRSVRNSQPQQTVNDTRDKCGNFGSSHSRRQVCPAKGKMCNSCHNWNHFSKVCCQVVRDNSIPQPAINWESTNLVDKWKKFQQHVDLIFEGPLADKDEKCGNFGSSHSRRQVCPAKAKMCNSCHKWNHFSKACCSTKSACRTS